MINELINWVENRPRFKDKTDLKKMQQAASFLGDPQNDYQVIHITGTNGKGSTAHFISSVLSQVKRVGLFTSPYVVKFNERIQINDQMISDADLLKNLSFMKTFIESYEAQTDETFTFFEIMTLMAFKYFSDQKVDYAIIEVGIGGTLDSTNIVNPRLSIITSLGFDHQNQLGDSLESILKNKLGIVKKHTPLITGVEGFDDQINAHATFMESAVFYLKDEMITIQQKSPLIFSFEHHTYKPNLQGIYQAKNASLAIMAMHYLEPKLPIKTIKKGISEAFNPGRFEIISEKPLIILDGAHNLSAMETLLKTIEATYPTYHKKVLFASMQDKPFLKLLDLIETITDDITLTTIDYHRALDIDGLNYQKIKDPILAFNTLSQSLAEDELLLVTGSLYFVSFIRNL